TNPFDEEIEQKWIKQWLFYANSIRFGTAMISYDYTTFEKGWWDSTTNLQEMHEWLMKRMK
ncbi:MAG TPA: hydroxylamine oxidase, partial [Deltaproteobacteria bacterium]|nr:hydroxylamine oxidase [Deltaproteobacteria bacterium]